MRFLMNWGRGVHVRVRVQVPAAPGPHASASAPNSLVRSYWDSIGVDHTMCRPKVVQGNLTSYNARPAQPLHGRRVRMFNPTPTALRKRVDRNMNTDYTSANVLLLGMLATAVILSASHIYEAGVERAKENPTSKSSHRDEEAANLFTPQTQYVEPYGTFNADRSE